MTHQHPEPPAGIFSRNPLEWFKVFGPGAVIASLTIGSGELIFSTRGGALFGPRILLLFGLVLLLKWALVYSAGRHMVLTGAHPFERWAELPGPHGWLPTVFLLLALVSFPVWVSFHAGVIGTLLAAATHPGTSDFGPLPYLWGAVVVAATLFLILRGGYAALEKLQLWIVGLLLLAVVATLFTLKLDWTGLFARLFDFQWLSYPAWAAKMPEFAQRPVWVEAITYFGVIGGSGYDYLAYATYLREKGWGRAGQGLANKNDIVAQPGWLRVLQVDCTLSFAAVLLFTTVFVICGAAVLAPKQQLPSGMDLLNFQAQFVGSHWFKPLYFIGVFLTMYGTL